jgi:hypothetical protein
VLQLTQKRAFRVSGILILLTALYALAGFVFAPRILRSALLEEIPKTLGVTPAVGEIRVNPFLLRLEVRDFSLTAADGEKLLGFARLFIDFESSSLWHRAYSFADIDIDSPSVNAVVAGDGKLNLLRLRPPESPAQPRAADGPMPALRIGSFKVRHGVVAYEDRSRPSAFTARLEPIDFELMNFTTGADGGRFTFTGSSKLGERVEWHGHVSVQPVESDGELRIDGLQAHTIWEYLEDRLNFVVDSGAIDLHVDYKFALRDAPDLQASVSKIALTNLAVRPKDTDADWITLPSLLIRGTTVNLAKRQARIDAVSIEGLKLTTWLAPDGSFNLLKLAQAPAAAGAAPAVKAPGSGAAPAPGAVHATPGAVSGAAAAEDPPWSVDLREFELKDAGISAEDRGISPAAKVLLAPLSIRVAGMSLDPAKPLTVSLDARINDSGSLNASGVVTPQPLATDMLLKLADIDLTAVQPYIGQRTSMTLQSGRLGGDARLRYGAGGPAMQFTGNISVTDLHTVDNALKDDFINCRRLDVTGVSYQRGPDRLEIGRVAARKLYARVMIEPDRSLNVARVLAGPGATVARPAAQGGSPVVATAPIEQQPVPGTRAHKGTIPATAPPPMPMTIKKIELHSGQADFADLSVQPNFATGVQGIEGTVLGLSSTIDSRATVDIRGAVDEFSPVAVTGKVNLLSAALYTDLAMSFRNMELSTFNPYSGKFAGYNITKGKLTTLLHYQVVGRKLDAQHHITVDQLEFGDKTESKDAVSLPVKLAVALLKDRNGVIDLDIPVNGTLDDPQFRLGSLIWKVFVDILDKAVTAPFALLGSLFGGGPDLQFIDFKPGTAQLDPSADDHGRAIVKALAERPQLKIEVPIAWVNDLDRPALVEAQFSAQARAAALARAGGRKAATVPDYDQLDPAGKAEVLTQLYEKNLGGEPKFPDAVTALKAKPEFAAARAEFLSKALHEHISIAESDLEDLGRQRALAIQRVLLTDTQTDPARVFLVANGKAKNEDGKVRLELTLQ